jgi:hypothetical protein
MRTMNRWEQPFRGATTLQDQINRIFGDMVVGRAGEESNLTPWAPAVDIYETEHEFAGPFWLEPMVDGLHVAIPKSLRREGPILLHRSAVLTTRAALGVQDVEHTRQVRLVLELHYAAERVALSSGRNVWANMCLQESRYLPLESGDLSRCFILLSFRHTRLPRMRTREKRFLQLLLPQPLRAGWQK